MTFRTSNGIQNARRGAASVLLAMIVATCLNDASAQTPTAKKEESDVNEPSCVL
jgi:hypothetical protein